MSTMTAKAVKTAPVSVSLGSCGTLSCEFVSGNPNYWGKYECTLKSESFSTPQKFFVSHNAESGNWALIAAATALLAEAGLR